MKDPTHPRLPKQQAFHELFDILEIPWKDEYLSEGGTVTGKGLNVLLGEVSFRSGFPQLDLPELEFNRLTLINKSLEACTLSLEMIKRSRAPYRTESFMTLFMNGWELILKAKLLDDKRNIFKTTGIWKTISFKECYKKIFTEENDPIRLNLVVLSELRNSASHFFIPFTPFSMIPILQAGIINYKNRLKEWFEIDIRKHIPEGSMILLVDKDYQKEESERIIRKLSKDARSFINNWETSIAEKIENINEEELNKFYNIIKWPLKENDKVTKSDVLNYLGVFDSYDGEQLSAL